MHFKMSTRAKAIIWNTNSSSCYTKFRRFFNWWIFVKLPSVFSDPLDLLDHPLLLDMYILPLRCPPVTCWGGIFHLRNTLMWVLRPSSSINSTTSLPYNQNILLGPSPSSINAIFFIHISNFFHKSNIFHFIWQIDANLLSSILHFIVTGPFVVKPQVNICFLVSL